MRSPRLLAPLLAGLLALSGCDPASPDTFTFGVTGIRFTFQFDGDEVNGGGAPITAAEMKNLLGEIQDREFSTADVVSIRLRDGSGQIRILNAPPGTDIDFLDAVSLRLTAGGSAVEVASQDDFGSMTGTMSGEAELDVTGADIAPIVAAGDFGAELDVAASAAEAGVTYRLETRFDVTVEVESP